MNRLFITGRKAIIVTKWQKPAELRSTVGWKVKHKTTVNP